MNIEGSALQISEARGMATGVEPKPEGVAATPGKYYSIVEANPECLVPGKRS